MGAPMLQHPFSTVVLALSLLLPRRAGRGHCIYAGTDQFIPQIYLLRRGLQCPHASWTRM